MAKVRLQARYLEKEKINKIAKIFGNKSTLLTLLSLLPPASSASSVILFPEIFSLNFIFFFKKF